MSQSTRADSFDELWSFHVPTEELFEDVRIDEDVDDEWKDVLTLEELLQQEEPREHEPEEKVEREERPKRRVTHKRKLPLESAGEGKKRKLYQHLPFSDPAKEKNRLNAINAKQNRERKKIEREAFLKEIKMLKEENQRLRKELQEALRKKSNCNKY